MTLAFALVTPIGFLLHSRFTFHEPLRWRAFWRFSAGVASAAPVAFAAMILLCSGLGLHVAIATPIATLIVFLWNFVAAHWAIVPQFKFRSAFRDRRNGFAGQIARKLLGPAFKPVGDAYRRIFVNLERIVDLLERELPRGAAVLDIGGGDGALIDRLLNRRPDIAVTMCDIAPVIGTFLSDAHRAKVKLLPATDFANIGGRFEIVMITDVMHHVPVGERNAFFASLAAACERWGARRLFFKDVEPGHLRSTLSLLADWHHRRPARRPVPARGVRRHGQASFPLGRAALSHARSPQLLRNAELVTAEPTTSDGDRFAAINAAMHAEMANAPEVVQPSRFWTELNRRHSERLAATGIANFKRTLAPAGCCRGIRRSASWSRGCRCRRRCALLPARSPRSGTIISR